MPMMAMSSADVVLNVLPMFYFSYGYLAVWEKYFGDEQVCEKKMVMMMIVMTRGGNEGNPSDNM